MFYTDVASCGGLRNAWGCGRLFGHIRLHPIGFYYNGSDWKELDREPES